MIDLVRAKKIPAVFSESTVPDDPAEQVARETGAAYGGVLYVDSLTGPDGPVPTYLDLLRITTSTIAEGLAKTISDSSGIKVKNATVTYRNGVTALKDASFEIPTGTITALVGVNGSGKSTLFKAIMGFVPLATGNVEILGQPAKRVSSARSKSPMCPRRRKWTGIFRFWSRTW